MNNLDSSQKTKPMPVILIPLIIFGIILLVNLILSGPSFFEIKVICAIHGEDSPLSCILHGGSFYGRLTDILRLSVPVMLLSFGMTFALATGGVDISVGGVMCISGCLAVAMIRGSGSAVDYVTPPMFLIIFVPLMVSFACGFWNGILISKLKIQPVIATLVFMVAGRGIANVITESRSLTTNYLPYKTLGGGFFLGFNISIYVAVGVFLLLWILTRRTAAGLYIESVGINSSAARYSGIKADFLIILIYAISGLCAGLAGLVMTSNLMYANSNSLGYMKELDAILAVVIGGTSMRGGKFYLGGSMIGALILGAVEITILSRSVAPEQILVVKAIVVVIIILIQSSVTQQFFSSIFRPAKKEVAINE